MNAEIAKRLNDIRAQKKELTDSIDKNKDFNKKVDFFGTAVSAFQKGFDSGAIENFLRGIMK